MKKLLVLALLGLGLGGGVWKLQNPEGTVDDLRSQATTLASRLTGGAQAGIQSIRKSNPTAQAATGEDTDAMASRLAELEGVLSDQESLAQRLSALEESSGTLATSTSNATTDNEQLVEITGLLSGAQSQIEATDQRLITQDEAIAETRTSVADLDQKITAVSASVAEFDVSVKDASAENEASIARMDAIDSRLDLLVRRLDEQTTASDLQSLNESVEAINTQVAQLEQNYNSIENSISSDLAAVNERADTLNLRISSLGSSNQLAATSEDDNSSTATEDSSDASSESAPTFNAGLDERFSAIESKLETVNSDSRIIASLNEQLIAARKKITQLEARDASTIQTVEEINSSIAELKTASESLSIDTVQTEVRDQLALVQSQFESNIADNNTDALEDLLNTTRNQIQTLEKRVQELPAASSEADNAQQIQSALESQIAALERRLVTVNKTDPALANTLSDVQDQVDQLTAKGFVTQDDLLAQKEGEAVEYKIYFDRNSTEVTADAAKVLNSFIAQEKNRTTGVSIFGFTDRRGSAIYNQQLALQRATNVRSFLIQNGLDFTKIIALSGLGEDAAAAVLPDDSDDAQQRVVILYAGQK